jgi:hypothetical protein
MLDDYLSYQEGNVPSRFCVPLAGAERAELDAWEESCAILVRERGLSGAGTPWPYRKEIAPAGGGYRFAVHPRKHERSGRDAVFLPCGCRRGTIYCLVYAGWVDGGSLLSLTPQSSSPLGSLEFSLAPVSPTKGVISQQWRLLRSSKTPAPWATFAL